MKSNLLRILLAAALVTVVGQSRAGTITGDPVADGWAQLGNSNELGTYVRGSGDFDYTLYTKSFSLTADEVTKLASDGNGSWTVGDVILGIGATVAGGANMNEYVRIIAKFGASGATFSPSTTLTTPGDGVGSSSMGGEGGITLSTRAIYRDSNNDLYPQSLTSANAGNVLNFTNPVSPDKSDPNYGNKTERRGASSSTDISRDEDVGRLIFQATNPGGVLSSFEVFLNVSALERAGYIINPAPGDAFVLALQEKNNASRDAFGETASVGAVPEPSSLVLAGLGAAGLAIALRRRSGW